MRTSPHTSVRTTTRPHLRRAAVAVALVSVSLTACADQGGEAEVATGAEAMQLDVGQISNSAAFFPLFVAEERGFFEEEGLTLGERPRLGTGAKLAATLQSGSIDIGAGVMTDAFNLHKINDSARIIGTLVDEYYVDVIAGAGIPTSLDDAPLAERVQALRGKSIGITGPGSGTEALVTFLLEQEGLDPATDVTLVNLGADPSAAIGALREGRVDALSFFQPVTQQAEATGVGRPYISPARGDVPELTNATHGVLFTDEDVLTSKPEAVEAFVRAIAKAEQVIAGDPQEVQELLQAYQGALDPATVELLVPVLQEEIPTAPEVTPEGYEKSAEFHRDSGLFAETPEFEAIVPEQFRADS